MIPQRLKKFLDEKEVPYEIVDHAEEFTAQEMAQTEHISGRKIAKTVMVRADGRDVMVVVPAHCRVDLLKLGAALWIEDGLSIEREDEFADLFPDCERGAMPPFGKLYGIPCFVDRSLFEEPDIWFNAGSHWESIRMSSAHYRRIMDAEIGDFAVPACVGV